MARDIDPALLRAFVTVAETGGMTAAARHLNLTQAAVSQQIKRLEELLGVVLFDRRQRQLSLTPAGERLIGQAGRMLSLNDEIWREMTAPEPEGEVRLGVPHDVIGPFLPPILKGFARSWPRVEVTIVSNLTLNLKRILAAGEIDLTLTTEPTTGGDAELLLSDRLVWVGAEGGEAHLKAPLPVTIGNESCAFRAATVKALAAGGRSWRALCTCADLTTLCATIEADLAIAPMLSQTVPSGLAILDESGLPPLPTFFVNLYRAPANQSPIAEEFARHISRSFAARYPQAARTAA